MPREVDVVVGLVLPKLAPGAKWPEVWAESNALDHAAGMVF